MRKGVYVTDPIRRALCALLCALCLLGGLTITTAKADGLSFGVIYNTDTLNLRAQSSSSSQWLGAYPRGTWVEIGWSDRNFYFVTLPDGNSGYMSKNYIDVSGDDGSSHQVAVVTNANGGKFLNFRTRPSYGAEVLGIFYDGVPLYVLGEVSGWYQVMLNDQTGYVRSEFVRTRYMPASTTVATIKTPNNTAMNLREGPGTGYAVIRQFPGDAYVMVLAEGNGWWRVCAGGVTGFMSKDFLVKGLESAKDIAARNGSSGGESYAVVKNPRSTQALNLRMFASTGSEVVSKLYNGTKLWVDMHGADWSAVTVQDTGESGFVMTKYLTLHNLPSTPKMTVYHPNGTYVNLRSQPDMLYGNVLVRVPSGKTVTVLVPGVEWCKVRYGNQSGYILSYFLQ